MDSLPGIRLHAWGGRDVLDNYYSCLSRWNQSVSGAVEFNCHTLHDERIDGHRWGNFIRAGDQQFVGDQKNKCGEYAARAGGGTFNCVGIKFDPILSEHGDSQYAHKDHNCSKHAHTTHLFTQQPPASNAPITTLTSRIAPE